MAVGKRIYLKRKMPDHEVMMQFKEIPASNVADVMERSCAMNPRIRLVSSPKAQMMVGPADDKSKKRRIFSSFTLRLIWPRKATYWVVSNEGDNTRALMGEIMMALLYHTKKAAGIILDGPIRDIDEIGKMGFSCVRYGNYTGRPIQRGTG